MEELSVFSLVTQQEYVEVHFFYGPSRIFPLSFYGAFR